MNQAKKIISGLSVVFSLFLGSCGESDKKSVQEGRPLILATSADNPPFENHDTSKNDQHIVGFDIDVAKAIGIQLGIAIDVKDMDFNSLIPALQAGRADFIMAGLAKTEERAKTVSFSTPYFKTNVSLITKAGVTLSKETDLSNKRIGTQLGSTHEHLLKRLHKNNPSIEMLSLNRLGELVQELRAGRLDGVLTEESVAKSYVGSNLDIESNILEGQEAEFCIAFPKESPWTEKFNGALKTLKENGTLEELRKKWFPL